MELNKRIITFKNDLNKIAELGWNEIKTTKYIIENLPLKYLKTNFLNKKVGVIYKFGKGKQSILIRADIDALKTKNGVEHTCGHSTHTAALMGAIVKNINLENEFSKKDKSIYFLFQPAEETFPSGANVFIKENPEIISKIQMAFAAHVRPMSSINEVNILKGSLMAQGDYFEIEVFGKTVHVKNAPEGFDSIAASAEIILFIKKIQNKFLKKSRIAIGIVSGGNQANTIANYSILKGDLRIFDKKTALKIKMEIERLLIKIEKKYQVKIKFSYFDGTPVLENNKNLAKIITKYLKNKKKFIITEHKNAKSFGTEDFSYISNKIPSIYALIGTGDKNDIHEENCTISDKGTILFSEYFNEVINWWLTF